MKMVHDEALTGTPPHVDSAKIFRHMLGEEVQKENAVSKSL